MTRTVHQEDAVAWLERAGTLEGCSIVTSMPDASEFNKLTRDEWAAWFTRTAALAIRATPIDGATIFYQRDVKVEGAWIDKAYLIQKAAEAEGARQLWHKIVARVRVGAVAYGKPGYSHLLCFSRGLSLEPAQSTPDILAEAGEPTWSRGMGVTVAKACCRFIAERTRTRTVVAPFCGEGLLLACANEAGLEAIGIERSPKRAERARIVKLAEAESAFAGDGALE